jgi:hypothetical protein
MAHCNIKTTSTTAAVIKGKGKKEIIMPAAALIQDLSFELLMAVNVQIVVSPL